MSGWVSAVRTATARGLTDQEPVPALLGRDGTCPSRPLDPFAAKPRLLGRQSPERTLLQGNNTPPFFFSLKDPLFL